MRTIHFLFPIAITLTLAGGCAGKTAAPPTIPRDALPEARQQVYADAELTFDGGFWKNTWKRSDGEYNLNSVAPAVDVYEESRAARSKAKKRGLVVTILAATGGAIIGTTLGMQLFPPPEEDQQLSGTTAGILYGTGAAFAVLGLVLESTWAKPAYREMATTYNTALRRDLALSP